MSESKQTVLVIEDHPILRDGLVQMINHEKDLKVVGAVGNYLEALEILMTTHPDIAIVDISLKGGNGIELVRDVKNRRGDIKFLVLSMHDESLFAERAIQAGAKGYVMKSEETSVVLKAIRQVLRGEYYVSAPTMSKIFGSMFDKRHDSFQSPLEKLSDREIEVLQLIGQGNNTRQIAEFLFLSIKTIQTYQQRIKEKLALSNSTELIQYATNWVNSSA